MSKENKSKKDPWREQEDPSDNCLIVMIRGFQERLVRFLIEDLFPVRRGTDMTEHQGDEVPEHLFIFFLSTHLCNVFERKEEVN